MDQCMLRAPSRKPTTLLACCKPPPLTDSIATLPNQGRCNNTRVSQMHVGQVLEGKDQFGCFLTAPAKQYRLP